MLKLNTLIGALLLASAVQAQESKIETQAIRCGALAYIHTSLSAANHAFGDAMTSSAQFYGGVFTAARENRAAITTKTGEVLERRDLVITELQKTWLSSAESVVREMALCNTWRASFATKVVTLKDSSTPAEVVQAVGVPPDRASTEEENKWRPIVTQAFTSWTSSVHPTRTEIKKSLKP